MDQEDRHSEFSVRDQFAHQQEQLEGRRRKRGTDAAANYVLKGRRRGRDSAAASPLRKRISVENFLVSLDYVNLLLSLYRRKWIILLGLLVSLAVGFGIGYLLRGTSYSAEALLLYKQNETRGVKPGADSSFTLTSLEMGTILQMIDFTEHLREVVELLGLELSPGQLSSRVDVIADKRSELVMLKATGCRSQDRAVRIVNTLADVAVRNNSEFYNTQVRDLHQQFSARAIEAKRSLEALNEKIVQFQLKNNVLEMKEEHRVYLDRLAATAERLSNAQLERDALRIRIENYRDLLEQMPEEVVRESYEENPLKAQIAHLEVALVEARSEYGPENPKIKLLERRLRETRRTASSADFAEHREKVYGPNKTRKEFEVDLMKLEAQQEEKKQQVAELQQELADLRDEFGEIPVQQRRLSELLGQQQVAEDFYLALKRSAEDAAVALQLDLADLEIMERATKATPHVNTASALFPPAAMILGLFGSVILCLLLELLDTRFHTARQIELFYNLPCIATLGQLDSLDSPVGQESRLNLARTVSEKLPILAKGESLHSLGMVSALSGEGKSTLAFDLACYYARLKLKTAYVDFNAGDNPALQYLARMEATPEGLDAYLRGDTSYENVTGLVKDVTVLGVHEEVADLLELTRTPQMLRLWETVCQDHDLTIVSLPPVIENAAGVALAGFPDHLGVVVEAGVTEKAVVDAMLDRLELQGLRPLGVILNKVDSLYSQGLKLGLDLSRTEHHRRRKTAIDI